MEDFNNIEPFNPQAQVIEKIKDEVALVRTETNYQTAITVAKPRDLTRVRENALTEARIGKNDMWYTWQVRNKKTGKKEWISPKGTIGLAQALLRSYGNCVINTTVEEKNGYWIFKSVFIDLENGVTTTRELQSKIPIGKNDNYDSERWRNMQFQIAQSKNQRDVILNGTPRWLQNECIEVAMEASKVKDNEAQEALKKGLTFFKQYNISDAELCAYFEKISIKEFTLDDITKMRNIGIQLKNGDIKAHEIKDQAKDIFDYNEAKKGDEPIPESKKQKEQKSNKVTKQKNTSKKTDIAKPLINNIKTIDPFTDVQAAETAEATAQKGLLKMYQAQLEETKNKDSLLYTAACDSLFITTEQLPATIDACEIVIAKIDELKKQYNK